MYITDAKNILILFIDYYPLVALKTLAIMDIDANNSMEEWVVIGAGEMAYLLRELLLNHEAQSLDPSTYVWWLTNTCDSSLRNLAPSGSLVAHVQIHSHR